MLMLGLLAVIDLALLAGAGVAGVHPAIVMIGHMLLSSMAVVLAFRANSTRGVAAMVGMALGPAGMIGGIFMASVWVWPGAARKSGAVSDDPKPAPASGAGAMVARLLDGRVRHPDPDGLGSLITILRHGTVDERRGALETAVRNFDPRLSPVVTRALTDDDQTIRALAAAAATRIAQRLAEERAAYAQAQATGDRENATRTGALLWDHSRFDILLSQTQRDQIARDVSGEDADRQQIMTLNDRWKAHDYAAIDRICADMAADGGIADPALRAAAQWWTQQPC